MRNGLLILEWESPMRVDQCNNVEDFRRLARRRLPAPIFHYIDGAADDEVTYRRNSEAYDQCDLVPNVLAGVNHIDLSTSVMGQKLAMPLFCSPTALQRLSNHGGRQLDGSRSPFDQLAEIVDAVGDKIDVICDGGIRRGTHVLKALSAGARACSGGRFYLYALAAAGQPGVERALGNLRPKSNVTCG
jgi:isopentenyl diphosphate isomerase/L-lactate dehydrogenase-like FMN-dependent dehydrogenase